MSWLDCVAADNQLINRSWSSADPFESALADNSALFRHLTSFAAGSPGGGFVLSEEHRPKHLNDNMVDFYRHRSDLTSFKDGCPLHF